MSKHQKLECIEPIEKIDRLSSLCFDLFRYCSEFVEINELLTLRYINKPLRQKVGLFQLAKRVRKELFNKYTVSQEFIDLVTQMGGVFAGDGLVNLLFGNSGNHLHHLEVCIPSCKEKEVNDWITQKYGKPLKRDYKITIGSKKYYYTIPKSSCNLRIFWVNRKSVTWLKNSFSLHQNSLNGTTLYISDPYLVSQRCYKIRLSGPEIEADALLGYFKVFSKFNCINGTESMVRYRIVGRWWTFKIYKVEGQIFAVEHSSNARDFFSTTRWIKIYRNKTEKQEAYTDIIKALQSEGCTLI